MISRTLAAALTVALLSIGNAVSADLSALRVFPNPARVHLGDTQITFQNAAGAELKIFNSAGRLVYETTIGDSQTVFPWELRNNDRKDVASGIYVYYLKSGSDSRKGKIGVIR